jgi:hypothetical protein
MDCTGEGKSRKATMFNFTVHKEEEDRVALAL